MPVHTWADNERLYAADLNSSFASVTALEGVRLTRTALLTLATATDTPVPFDSEIRDDLNGHSNVTNNTRITVPRAGWYLFGGGGQFVANATGYRQISVTLNVGASVICAENVAGSSVTAQRIAVAGIRYLAANDYIELRAYQSSGGNLDLQLVSEVSPLFWCIPLRGS